jgi:hypothetical protein
VVPAGLLVELEEAEHREQLEGRPSRRTGGEVGVGVVDPAVGDGGLVDLGTELLDQRVLLPTEGSRVVAHGAHGREHVAHDLSHGPHDA